MKITLLGVRGSIPTSNPETRRYGGNTSCVKVEMGTDVIVLDAGSGIQNLHFADNLSHQRIDILLTHLHIDHIQGLGFFQPLFNPDAEVHIWGPASNEQSLRTRLGRYFSPPFSPVYFREFNCNLFVHEIDNSSFTIGSFSIESRFVMHPGPTLGFRMHDGTRTFTYIPDHEPMLGAKEMHTDLKWLSGSDLSIGTDLLLHDAQFTAAEYVHKVGWGHSAMEDTMVYAKLMKVKHLLLSHHDPGRTDIQLDDLYQKLLESTAPSFPFAMAVEGSSIEL